MNCIHCGAEIFEETDDLITCGGMYPVWYSRFGEHGRQMSCDSWNVQTHEPDEVEKAK